MPVKIRFWNALSDREKNVLLNRSEEDIAAVRESVLAILERVKRDKDRAIIECTEKFDRVKLSLPLRVGEQEFEEAEARLGADVKEALHFAIENVRLFHEAQKPESLRFLETKPGIFAGEKASAVPSVGLYVPRGRGSFPSMLYMLAVPAQVAGVKRICVVTPPDKDGSVDPACLYAARLCRVTEIYRVGGAQAIAGLAYGTESIPKVAKILGPGSMYVSAAKRLVSDIVDIGLPAGPSESIVLADTSADPKFVALDLMIEAEHGSDSSALLVTPSRELAESVAATIETFLAELPEPRKTFVRDVMNGYGGIIVTDTMEEAVQVVNEFAPEHLQIQTRDPFELLSSIEHAGEILLGSNTPFSAANYAIGANAVLPTGGKAKTYSAVSVRDFIKYSSVIYMTKSGYETLKPHIMTLADYEGFFAHAFALRKRGEQS